MTRTELYKDLRMNMEFEVGTSIVIMRRKRYDQLIKCENLVKKHYKDMMTDIDEEVKDIEGYELDRLMAYLDEQVRRKYDKD